MGYIKKLTTLLCVRKEKKKCTEVKNIFNKMHKPAFRILLKKFTEKNNVIYLNFLKFTFVKSFLKRNEIFFPTKYFEIIFKSQF